MNISNNYKYINKSTHSRKTSQDWHEYFLSFSPNHPSPDNPLQWVESLKDTRISVLDALIRLSNVYLDVRPTQETIARISNVSIRTVARAIDYFRESGMLVTNYRHKCSSQYKLSPFFFELKNRLKLKKILWACKYLPVVWLLALPLSSKSAFFNHLADNINIGREYIYPNPYINKERKREGGWLGEFFDVKRGEYRMSAEKIYPVSEAIRGDVTKRLNLTRAGQISLSAYPDEAIRWAYDALRFFNVAKNPFNFFVFKCKEYCQSNGLKPDWEHPQLLRSHFKIRENAKPFFDHPLPTIPPVQERAVERRTSGSFKPIISTPSARRNSDYSPYTPYRGTPALGDQERKLFLLREISNFTMMLKDKADVLPEFMREPTIQIWKNRLECCQKELEELGVQKEI